MKTCPKCGKELVGEEEKCPSCGTYFVDRFGQILASEQGLKRAISMTSYIMGAICIVAILILLIIGLPQFDGVNPYGWTYLGIASFLLLDTILLAALFIHNRSDNVLAGKHQTIFCIVTSILGLFPVAIPFLIRGRRIRKKLELDELPIGK